jgi:hypothetical protein
MEGENGKLCRGHDLALLGVAAHNGMGIQRHHCPPKALWPHHNRGNGGGYPRKTWRKSARLRSTSALLKSPLLQNAVPDTVQQKGRKRRRTPAVGDKEEGDNGVGAIVSWDGDVVKKQLSK